MARRVENQFLLHQSNRTCITGTYILDISKKIKCKGNVTKGKSIFGVELGALNCSQLSQLFIYLILLTRRDCRSKRHGTRGTTDFAPMHDPRLLVTSAVPGYEHIKFPLSVLNGSSRP